MHCRSWRERLLLPHIARQLEHVDVSRRVLARRNTSADGSWGLQQTSHTGPDEGLPRHFVHRKGDTATGNVGEASRARFDRGLVPVRPAGPWRRRRLIRQPQRERGHQSSRDADLADGDSAEELAGELDDGHSSRGWNALHGQAKQPATLSTGIPRVGSVRTRQLRLQARAVTQDRQIACLPRFCSPSCSPDGPLRQGLPAAGIRSTGLSWENFRAGSQDPGRVLACIARGQRPSFRVRNMLLTCGNVKLRKSGP
jgi:hypothetical protein